MVYGIGTTSCRYLHQAERVVADFVATIDGGDPHPRPELDITITLGARP